MNVLETWYSRLDEVDFLAMHHSKFGSGDIMNSLWSIIGQPKNRQIISWIGGGIVAVAAGAFAVVTYLWPAHDSKGGVNCAENASIASQGDVSHVTINANGATQQANAGLSCGNSAAAKP